MFEFDVTAVIVYSIGFLVWLIIWHYLVGYSLLNKMKLLYITFFGALFVLATNIVLGFFASVPEHSTELLIYPYVEENAKTVAHFALVISVFVVLSVQRQQISLASIRIKLFLWLVFWSFLLSALGALPLYWVPAEKYWLTTLRHIKTLPFCYSIFLLGSAIILFIYEISYQRKKSSEIDLR
jgi:hypothetical protein